MRRDKSQNCLELIDLLNITEESTKQEFKVLYGDLSVEEKSELEKVADQLRSDKEMDKLNDVDVKDILSSSEVEIYNSVLYEAKGTSALNHTTGNLVVVVKVTRLCNLRCTYCRSWREGANQTMKFATMLKTVLYALAIPEIHTIDFVWHGGEVTMLKTGIFRKLLWLQANLKHENQKIKNTIQTNAVGLTDEWASLLAQYKVTVGVSIDGPPEINDSVRLDTLGNKTSDAIANGVEKLKENNVRYSALVVVSETLINVGVDRVFSYFKSINLNNINFLNVIPDIYSDACDVNSRNYIPYDEYVNFLCQAFNLWKEKYRDSIKIADFEDLMVAIRNVSKPVMCLWSGDCLSSIVTVEPDGTVNPCDKYIGEEPVSYGSIHDSTLSHLINQSDFVLKEQSNYRDSVDRMADCQWRSICHGGCPHDRALDKKIRNITGAECCGLSPLLTLMQEYVASEFSSTPSLEMTQ